MMPKTASHTPADTPPPVAPVRVSSAPGFVLARCPLVFAFVWVPPKLTFQFDESNIPDVPVCSALFGPRLVSLLRLRFNGGRVTWHHFRMTKSNATSPAPAIKIMGLILSPPMVGAGCLIGERVPTVYRFPFCPTSGIPPAPAMVRYL